MSTRSRRSLWRLGGAALLSLIAVLAAGRLPGCGCSVHRPLAGQGSLSREDRLEGPWRGRWESSGGVMAGELLCQVRKLEADRYEANFDAEVAGGILRNRSTVVLTVSQRGQVWKFAGEEDLGFLAGGVYRYEGSSDGRWFQCTYDSKFDKGVFRLNRGPATTTTVPSPAPAPAPVPRP